MIIRLDKNSMTVQVVCGILEKYEPNETTIEICRKVEALQDKLNKINEKMVLPALKEIEALIKAENAKFIPAKSLPTDADDLPV